MQLKIGTNNIFDVNSTLITSQIRTLWNHGGQPYARHVKVHVAGYLSGSGQDDIATKAGNLTTALATNYQDFVFYADDGSATDIALYNRLSNTGIQVHMLEYPEARGPEYANIRSFAFEVEAEFPLANTQRLLLKFTESMTFSGGGPIYRFRMAINGKPQKQLTYPASPFRVIQSGSITGYRTWPTLPPSQWPGALMETPTITRVAPRRMGQAIVPNYEGFTINYSYHHEAIAPLVGVPTFWIS